MCHDGVGNLVKSWPTQLTNTHPSRSPPHDIIVQQTLYFERVVQAGRAMMTKYADSAYWFIHYLIIKLLFII